MKGLKIFLIILIVALVLLIGLNAYATKKGYSNCFNMIKALATDKNVEQEEDNTQGSETTVPPVISVPEEEPATEPTTEASGMGEGEEPTTLTNEEKYSKIIKEYRDAMNDSKYNEEILDSKYPNVNTTMMHYYHAYNLKFGYAFYDINGDKKDELLILDEFENDSQELTYSIIDLYGFNGTNPVKLIKENTMGDRTKVTIFENGIIYLHGSGGAASGILGFYKIKADGYSMEVTNYYYEYSDSTTVSIYANSDKTQKLDYTSTQQVVDVYKGNSENVKLSTLQVVDL